MARNKIQPAARQVHTGANSDGLVPTLDNPNPRLGSAKNTIVERALDPMGENKLTPAPMKGGTYGVIPEAEKRVHFHAGTAVRKDAIPARRPKTFVIIDGPRNAQNKITFMYDHQRVSVGYGKEVTESTYDLDLLRRQGCKLEEVLDPLGDAQAAAIESVVEVVSPDANPREGDDDGDKEDESEEMDHGDDKE